jgi:hypothetical protein
MSKTLFGVVENDAIVPVVSNSVLHRVTEFSLMLIRNSTAAHREARDILHARELLRREQISKQRRFDVAPRLLGGWLMSEYGEKNRRAWRKFESQGPPVAPTGMCLPLLLISATLYWEEKK